MKYNKVCISGLSVLSDEVVQSYKTKIEARCPGAQVDIVSKDVLTEAEVIEKMQGYDIIMSGFQEMTERAYAETSFKAYITCSVGFEFANVAAATKNGVIVANNPAYCSEEVADHATALILGCARGAFKMGRLVREGKWGSFNIAPLKRFSTCTVGLFGFGRIPRIVAKNLSGFGVRVISYDPYLTPDKVAGMNVTLVDFETLLAESDFISINVPLNDSTRGVFNAEAFRKMKKTAFIINTARGPVINQEELYEALVAGEIQGAALDVTNSEPPGEDERRLMELPNVVCTGHTGSYSEEALIAQTDLTVDNVVRVLEGNLPENIINKEVLATVDWYK